STLLTRAAEILDARGVIVWVADRSGVALYPMFTHGYPAAVLVRVGTISTDANNATAAAWRSGELVAVQGEPDSPGALVTPIITADGGVGVLAGGVPHGRARAAGGVKTSVPWPRSSPRNSRPSSRRWPKSARLAWSTASPPSVVRAG